MKKKILALSFILILAVTALTGCNQGESVQISQITTKAATTEQTTTTTVCDEWDTPETPEPEREIKTSAETREELIAIYLKAFSEKDTEVLSAFRCGNYDKMFNDLCKALDDAGNLPEDVDDILRHSIKFCVKAKPIRQSSACKASGVWDFLLIALIPWADTVCAPKA